MNGCGTLYASRKDCSNSHSDTNPLRGGSPAMASTPMSVSHATHGIRWMRPPRCPRLRSPVACNTAPVPEKQQTLHERMIHRVIHDGNQGEYRRCAHADARKHDRKPKSGKHDSDVFDRGIGQQPFHIGLRGGKHDAIQRAEQPERERQQTPPPERLTQQIEAHSNHAVQRRLEHDAAHERGHGRGRGGMRFRQPYVQGHEACLGAKPDQRETEGNRRPIGSEVRGTHGVEREMPATPLKNAKTQQDRYRTEMSHHQVEKAGLANFGNTMLGRDQSVSRASGVEPVPMGR